MKIRTIKRHDPAFSISDGYLVTGRASIEINQDCPDEIKQLVVQALLYGWINVQAHVLEQELVWENLSK
jgi:hypothetical protein